MEHHNLEMEENSNSVRESVNDFLCFLQAQIDAQQKLLEEEENNDYRLMIIDTLVPLKLKKKLMKRALKSFDKKQSKYLEWFNDDESLLEFVELGHECKAGRYSDYCTESSISVEIKNMNFVGKFLLGKSVVKLLEKEACMCVASDK